MVLSFESDCFGIASKSKRTPSGIKIAQKTQRLGKTQESLKKQQRMASPTKTKTAKVPYPIFPAISPIYISFCYET